MAKNKKFDIMESLNFSQAKTSNRSPVTDDLPVKSDAFSREQEANFNIDDSIKTEPAVPKENIEISKTDTPKRDILEGDNNMPPTTSHIDIEEDQSLNLGVLKRRKSKIRNKRRVLLITEEMDEALVEAANYFGVSVNEFMNEVLKQILFPEK